MPSAIEQVHRKYRERGLRLLAVNIQEPRERVAAWVRARKVSVPVLLDEDGEAAQNWRVTATPTVFVVRDGKLLAWGSGNRPWTDPPGQAFLDALTAP